MIVTTSSYIFLWQLCEENLAPEIVDQMKKDCENLVGNLDAIRDLFDNIEAVCAAKGIDIEIPIIDICGKTREMSLCILLSVY